MNTEASPRIHLIVLAGGSGNRARSVDSAPPKQFQPVGGRMMLMWSLAELSACSGVASITVAAPVSWHPVVRGEIEAADLAPTVLVAPAGASRTASTWNASVLVSGRCSPAEDDLVAVHDAARPFASRFLLDRLAEAASRHGGAVPGVPVADTVVQLAGQKGGQAAVRYLERDSLRGVQTPQVFRWAPFFAAHRDCHDRAEAFTDDGGMMAAAGLPPVVVMGEAENWKVTTEDDLARADAALRDRS